jgi:hypothetical protein
MDRIAVLKAGIERTKTRIRDLESRLKKSGVRIAGMERMIASLKETVTEKEGLVAQLSSRVDSLQTQVTGLVAEVQVNQENLRERDEQLEQRRRELATIYYTIGTKKDLTQAGVVVAKGGLLGMGKTLQPSGAIDQTRSTPLDTDQESVVRTAAAKVQVLSAQPPSSYELQLVDGKMELRILDPVEFRKVKHLVLLTS